LPEEHLASAVLAWFDPAAGRLYYANAGHPTSFLSSPDSPRTDLESGGPVLGLIPGAEHPYVVLDVVPGSRLLVCTDGVTEARDQEGRLWGADELVAILESSRLDDLSRVAERIVERLEQRRGARAQEDDVTFALAERLPS
jgi:serine phosphatase RsbU (regulator of sigma subunit)